MIKIYFFTKEETHTSLKNKNFTGKVIVFYHNPGNYSCYDYQYISSKNNGSTFFIENKIGGADIY